MNHSLKSTRWEIVISSHGAELQSLFHMPSDTELLWQGNAAFWGRRSPVLFPNVGKLKANQAIWKNRMLCLPQHGFARDSEFDLIEKTDDLLVFQLCDSEESTVFFPAKFQLEIRYSIVVDSFKVEYKLLNSGTETLIAGLGAHPAFNCPFRKEESFENYQLTWEKDETFMRNELMEGLLTADFSKLQVVDRKLDLSDDLFERDALVFHGLNSNWVELHPSDRKHVLKFSWENFQSFGIWTKKSAPFLCLEPWNGHADLENTTGNWEEKPRMIRLEPGERHSSCWSVTFSTR